MSDRVKIYWRVESLTTSLLVFAVVILIGALILVALAYA